jgi:hypothetical protein
MEGLERTRLSIISLIYLWYSSVDTEVNYQPFSNIVPAGSKSTSKALNTKTPCRKIMKAKETSNRGNASNKIKVALVNIAGRMHERMRARASE